MRLSLLKTLAAVLDTGSTQGAARVLGLSQSAVSRRISQLEAELRLPLFVRDRTRLIPTRECAQLEPQIRVLAERGRGLVAEAEALRDGNSPTTTLRVAFPASLTLSIVPAIVANFLAENDRVQVEVHTGSYDTIERMLQDGRAEMGFIRLPSQRANLVLRPLMSVRTVCVMPQGHPLAALDRVGIRDLSGVPLILLGRMRPPRSEIDRVFWKAGVKPRIRVEAHSVLSACGMVAAGLGITLVNELMAWDYAHLAIEIRPLDVVLDHAFAFAAADGPPATRAAETFMQTAESFLRQIVYR